MRRELKTEKTKEKIINAAMNEFSLHGYEKGSINEICRTGINKGLIYHNYKNKDEIYLICVEKSCKSYLEFIQDNMTEINLEQYIRVRGRFAQTKEGRIFLEALLYPQIHLEKQIHTILLPFYEHRKELLNKTLSLVKFHNGWTMEEAERHISMMIDAYNGYFYHKKGNDFELQDIICDHEQNIPRIIDLFLYGVASNQNIK